jgi:ABC-2 type transport system ATP-binding protein
MSNLVEVKGVYKAYKKADGSDNQVYSDFSLSLDEGKHLVCMTGPDGAGKSTLLKMLAGLVKPDRGELWLLGDRPSNSSPKFASRIGYMSQTLGLYMELSVIENLRLISGLKNFDLKNNGDYLLELLRKVDLLRFKDYAAGSLSGGMKQKLALTCALACRPEVLILDEPTVGVDPVSREELWAIVFDYLKESQAYCLFTSAYLEEAAFADEVLVCNEGKIVLRGQASELVKGCEDETYALNPQDLNYQQYARQMMFASYLYDKSSPIMDVCPRVGRIDVLLLKGKRYEDLMSYLRRKFPDYIAKIKVSKRPSILEDVYINATWNPHLKMPNLDEAQRANFKREEVVIDVHEIKKVFGNFTAVEHSNFQVHRGEIFGLLGPNGAGKTTTFRMICALLPPTEGEVLVNGFDLRYAKASARATIGYVSQKFSLYRTLSCVQNLEYFGRSYGLFGKKLQARIEELLEEFSLQKFAHTRSEALPFGVQRQLSMACALIHKPKILFLDEATSGADPLARRNFWNRVNALCVEGTSIIVTTHFMEEAEYCDRFLIQDHGKILVLGEPSKICVKDGKRISVEEAFVDKVHEFRQSLKEGV